MDSLPAHRMVYLHKCGNLRKISIPPFYLIERSTSLIFDISDSLVYLAIDLWKITMQLKINLLKFVLILLTIYHRIELMRRKTVREFNSGIQISYTNLSAPASVRGLLMLRLYGVPIMSLSFSDIFLARWASWDNFSLAGLNQK